MMSTNKKPRECTMGEMVEHYDYPGFTLYPFYHRSGKMPWAAAIELRLDKVDRIIWLSGHTGRDPETDREPRNWEEERKGVGRVVGGIKEQTLAAWTRIKEILDGLGASLEDIFQIYYYLVNRDDAWDMFEATESFFAEHCPDLNENPRAGVLLKGIQLDLPDMLIEIEVAAATGKK